MGTPKRKQPRTCTECGRTFEGTERALYCQDACRLRAYFRTHRATLVAQQRQRRAARKHHQPSPDAPTAAAD